jgi:hypothetical protein
MKMKKILVLDDDKSLGSHHIGQLNKLPGFRKKFAAEPVTPEEFKAIVDTLETRRAQARNAEPPAYTDTCKLDDANLLIVDYDLLSLKSAGVMTGENVAYLARCFSQCGFILGLNQFGVNPFDLTLKGHPESFADLNIGSEQLTTPGLWAQPWRGLRPWAWPMIPEAIESFEGRVSDLKRSMDQRILSWLEIPDVIAKLLPRSATEFITKGSTAAETTFRDFVLHSGNGLLGRLDKTSEECKVRIAAARIAKWLERFVLTGQDILVDAPHLAVRYPSLLKGPTSKASSFDRTAAFGKPAELGIHHEKISSALFPKPNWLSRPAWFWPTLSSLSAIDEVLDPWKAKQTDLAFCEDISRFKPKATCHEFVADIPSPFARRYAAKVSNVEYRPEVRFSL